MTLRSRVPAAGLALFAGLLLPWSPAAAVSGQTAGARLPEAPGKKVVMTVCTTCHDTDVITDGPRTVPVWIDTVRSMRDFGAELTDEQLKTVTDYLLVNLALLQVNRARAEEFVPVLGVTIEVADAVVAQREREGPFRTVDELKRAPGLDAARLDAVAPRLLFSN
jgi:competence protein ComEA